MSNHSLPDVLTRSRKVWTVASEETEYQIYERDPELFLTYSPESALIRREMLLNQYRQQDELAQVVNRAIAQLPAMQQTVIRLRYFGDGVDAYTAKDMAEKLGVSVRTYYNVLNEAKAALRRQLEMQAVVVEYFNARLDV